MPTACSAKGLPRGLAKTVLSVSPPRLCRMGPQRRLLFSGKKPLQPFLGVGVGVGATGCSVNSPHRARSQPPFLRTPPPSFSLEAPGEAAPGCQGNRSIVSCRRVEPAAPPPPRRPAQPQASASTAGGDFAGSLLFTQFVPFSLSEAQLGAQASHPS